MPFASPSRPNTFKFYKEAFQVFRSGVLWLNENGSIIGTNAKTSELLKYREEELLQKTIFEIDPRVTFLEWKKIWESLQQKQKYNKETEYFTSDQLFVPVAVDGVLLWFEDTARVLLVVEDLMESYRLRDLLEVISTAGKVGSWSLDLVRHEVTLTGECQRLLGLPDPISTHPSRVFLQQLEAFIAAEELAALGEKVQESIASGTAFESEVIFEPKQGEFRRLLINGFSQTSESGQIIKLFGAVKDISSFEAKTENLYLTQFTIDHANEMIFWFRPDGSIAYVNRAACDRLGYTQQEFLKLSAHEIAPDFTKEVREELWHDLREKKYLEYETNLLTKQGQSFPLFSTLNYIKFKGQEFNCVYSTDYTEQKEAQRKLLLSQFALENAREMILWVDASGHIIFVNKRFCERTGFEESETADIDLIALFSGLEEYASKEEFWRELQQEKQLESESMLRLKDGTLIPVYCSFNYILFEDQALNCIFMLDWTKKKQRDEEIRLAKETFSIAAEFVFWLDKAGRVAYTNQAARKALGFSNHEIKGLPFTKLCDDPLVFEEQEEYQQKEIFLRARNGKEVPTELSRNQIELDGEVRWCFIGRDISERKKRELELIRAKQQVEELSVRLQGENVLLREEINNTYNFNNIITGSPKYKKILKQVAQVADSKATVLILGETGTGKELLARAIHSLSDRDGAPLIKINCAALPPHLIESELFGHEKGAFTGAFQQKKGRFEMANGGTIFLDELGEMPLDVQAKLLRVLQESELERVGGTSTIKVDVRIVGATNRNLQEMVDKGEFREDLYYRLNVFPIINLPLRERQQDIPLLIKHFTRKYSKELGKKIEKVSEADIKLLQNYAFPGNIRELENIIERAVIISDGDTLDLRSSFKRSQSKTVDKPPTFLSFEEMQRKHILEALKLTNWRVTGPRGAARLLHLNDRTLASKMRKLGIRRESF